MTYLLLAIAVAVVIVARARVATIRVRVVGVVSCRSRSDPRVALDLATYSESTAVLAAL